MALYLVTSSHDDVKYSNIFLFLHETRDHHLILKLNIIIFIIRLININGNGFSFRDYLYYFTKPNNIIGMCIFINSVQFHS